MVEEVPMSRKPIVFLGLPVVSLVLGVIAGQWFYGLYERSIPEALKATTSMQGTRIVFWLHGLGLGVVLSILALVGVALGRFLSRAPSPGSASPPGTR
jgi:uncharacterized membrane protein